MRLSATEGDLLARLAVAAGILVQTTFTPWHSISHDDARTCKRLAKKGFVDVDDKAGFRVNAAGIERSKTIY